MNKLKVTQLIKINPLVQRIADTKSHETNKVTITPFVGYCMKDNKETLCFGFEKEDGEVCVYAGSALPVSRIFQAWRSATMLTKLLFITEPLLFDIWNSMGRDSNHLSDDVVAAACRNYNEFKSIRDFVLTLHPAKAEYANAMFALKEAGVEIDIKEIVDEKKRLLEKQILEKCNTDIHALHEAARIMETYESDDTDYPKNMFDALKEKIGKDNALLFVISFLRRKFKYGNVYNDTDIEIGVNKALLRYQIL